MNEILAWMSSPVFEAFGNPVSWIELIGFVTGVACVFAVAKQYLWNWPVGILNNIAFLILFIGSGLYADAFLQIVFGVIALYGWYNWSRGRKSTEIKNDLPIRNHTSTELIYGITAMILGTAAVGFLLSIATNSTVPVPDAFVLAGSLVATYGQAKKIISQWWVWIIVDVVSIPLYFSKGLILTAILYVGFLCLCIYGLFDWKRSMNAQQTEEPNLELVAV